MATQGIVSIVEEGTVAIKVVAGCDGYNADALVSAIEDGGLRTPSEIMAAARGVGFGSTESLVVQTPTANHYAGPDDLGELYFSAEHFRDPYFNPRWEWGTADVVRVVTR